MIYDDAYVEPTGDGKIQVTFLGPEGVRTFRMTPDKAAEFGEALRRAAKRKYK